ncbi:MAG: hypothetical protein Ta2F_14940 [Termitinemataceae bacterium]|nr:MAG: hypothetical protein Ta2F_14940 [Termitinemataceae bacterium]
MKNRILLKIVGFAALYAVMFVVISLLQFAWQGSFSRQLGNLRVSGTFAGKDLAGAQREQKPASSYSGLLDDDPHASGKEYFVSDGVGVFFGGLEFFLSSTELYGLVYVDSQNTKHPLKPDIMTLSTEAVRFKLQNSIEISFYIQREDDVEELIISTIMPEDVRGLEVPYRPSLKARTKINAGSGTSNSSMYVNYSGSDYMFDRAILDTSRRVIILSNKNPIIVYRIVPDEKQSNPADFIISGAMEKTRYDELLAKWCGKALVNLEQQVFNGTNNEEIITAYVAETARRGSYQSATDNIPESFTSSQSRTFLSAPFLGRLDLGLRTLKTSDRNIMDTYSELLKDKPLDFFKSERALEYIALRDRDTVFDTAVEFETAIPPSSITFDLCASVFEDWWTWWQWKQERQSTNNVDKAANANPFDPLVAEAKRILAQLAVMDSEHKTMFMVQDKTVDVLYNLRLGIAVAAYGEASKKSEWAAIGRSLVLSALSFAADNGTLRSIFDYTEIQNPENTGLNAQQSSFSFVPRTNSDTITTATIYKILRFSDYYPHAVGAGSVYNGVWIWTISPVVAASYQQNVLDIAVSFPVDQAHYLLINGVGPFSKIQMRDTDYRSDPQFERYASHGWAYSASERTLLLKLVHRNQLEHIKIFF